MSEISESLLQDLRKAEGILFQWWSSIHRDKDTKQRMRFQAVCPELYLLPEVDHFTELIESISPELTKFLVPDPRQDLVQHCIIPIIGVLPWIDYDVERSIPHELFKSRYVNRQFASMRLADTTGKMFPCFLKVVKCLRHRVNVRELVYAMLVWHDKELGKALKQSWSKVLFPNDIVLQWPTYLDAC